MDQGNGPHMEYLGYQDFFDIDQDFFGEEQIHGDNQATDFNIGHGDDDVDFFGNDPDFEEIVTQAYNEMVQQQQYNPYNNYYPSYQPSSENNQNNQNNQNTISSIMHNNVLVTDKKDVDDFFSRSSCVSIPDETMMQYRNVDFDYCQAGHFPARQACHTMKVLTLISKKHNIPLTQLYQETGSKEMFNCQASNEKGDQCNGTCVAGRFFCGRHNAIPGNTQMKGIELYNQRLDGSQQLPMKQSRDSREKKKDKKNKKQKLSHDNY